MADTPQTLALIVLATQYRPQIVQQTNRRSALLRLLPIVPGEGKTCAWTVEADGAIGENFSDGADAANFGSDSQVGASLSWGLYRSNFRVTGLAQAASSSSASPAGNRQLWGRNLVNASAKLASTINGVIHSGAGTGTTMAGLGVAVGDDTNTYAGIDRTSYSWWQPYVVDPGSLTAPTFKQIRTDIQTIFDASGETPDIAVCPGAVFNKVGSLFDPNRHYVQDVVTARGMVKLDMGFEGIMVDSTLFVKDKDATANTIRYINSNHVRVEYLPPASPAVRKLLEELVQADDGFGALPLGFIYEMLAKTGDSDKAQVKSYLQLVCDKPNSCGTRKNVATT